MCGTHIRYTLGTQMGHKLPYLTQSKTGWYEYRRRIPQDLRPSFGNIREFKKALGTTSLKEAVVKWAIVNREYEVIASRHSRLQNANGSPLTTDVVDEATAIAKRLERPMLPAGATASERAAFEIEEDAWLFAVEQVLDELADDYVDDEQRKIDYATGEWFKPGYQTPYKVTSPTDPRAIALKHVRDGAAIQLKPTWRDALEAYLVVNKSDKMRDEAKQAVYDKKTRSFLEKFGLSLGKQGSSTPLDAITRQHARAFYEAHTPSTGNRYNNTFSAVINSWNREYPDKKAYNPFAGLSNKEREEKTSTKRKSFSPDQWHSYVKALEEWHNRELGLIGLLMAFTGCRTNEAAGLAADEVRLDEKVPNVVFRSNSIRSMDKGGLERAVPIFEPLVSYLRAYQGDTITTTTENPNSFFKKYGAYRHFTNVSQQLGNLLKDKVGIVDKRLVPYSFRHSIHDRARIARVPTDIQHYIVGHKSSGSSRIHFKYGTRTPPSVLVDDMKAILDQKVWDTEFD